MSQMRRATVRDFVVSILSIFGDFDFSLPQVATLLLLDEEGEMAIKQVAEIVGRTVSATSRLLDQLVGHGLVSRREDTVDRRVKRVAITEQGRALIATLEQQRADAQFATLEYLSAEERAEFMRSMALIAEAGKRRRHEHSTPETPIE